MICDIWCMNVWCIGRNIGSLTTSEYTRTSLSTVTKPSWSWSAVRRTVSCRNLPFTLLSNKAEFILTFQVVLIPCSHEVVSNTSVVHHHDLPGLPTGGEQPHLRKFPAPVPWQALCSYCRINTVWGAFTAIWSYSGSRPSPTRCPSSTVADYSAQRWRSSRQMSLCSTPRRGWWWAQHWMVRANSTEPTPNQIRTTTHVCPGYWLFSKVNISSTVIQSSQGF